MTYLTDVMMEVGLPTGLGNSEIESKMSIHLELMPAGQKLLLDLDGNGEKKAFIVFDSLFDPEDNKQIIIVRRA
jgi:hypothetical protein